MSNLPALTFANNNDLALPNEMLDSMKSMFDEAFNGLGGSFRKLKVRKMDFAVIDGGSTEVIPANQMFGVFLGAAQHNHCVWYEKPFAPGTEPETPDLVWIQPTPNVFPDALPAQHRVKQTINNMERWSFQICRRIVIAIVRRDMSGNMTLDLERPVAMDISSMSLFGKGLPDQHMYKWSGIRDVCMQNSSGGVQIMPFMFPMQIIIDPATSVTGVVMFSPLRDATGRLSLFDSTLIAKIYNCATSEAVRDMVQVRERLTYGATSQPTPPVATPPVATPPVATPPVVTPPVATPPVATPPVATPPVVTPPVATPPVATPPVATPPVATPPVATPPVMQQQTSTDATIGGLLNQANALLNAGAVSTSPTTQAPAQATPPVTLPDDVAATSISNIMAQLGA